MKPGESLMLLLKSIGIEPSQGCRCHETAALMNVLGLEGCMEPGNYHKILTTLEEDSVNYSWTKRITAAGKLVLQGQRIYTINGLLNKALRDCEKSSTQ